MNRAPQVPITRADKSVLNPVYTGFVSEVTPSDFGLNYQKMFPRKTFKSNGDGRGYFRKRLHMDALRALDDDQLIRTPGAPAVKLDRGLSLQTFGVKRRHVDAVVVDDEADLLTRMEGGITDPNVTEVKWVRELMMLHAERRAAAFAANNANFGGYMSPAKPWSDKTADVISDIIGAKLAIRRQCGMLANKMSITYEAALALVQNEGILKIRGIVKDRDYTENGLATILKQAFGFDEVRIMMAVYSPRRPNVMGEYSIDPVWAHDAIVYYEPKGGADFAKMSWSVEGVDTFYYGGLDTGVYTFRSEDAETTYHRVKEDSDMILLNPECAFAIRGVLA